MSTLNLVVPALYWKHRAYTGDLSGFDPDLVAETLGEHVFGFFLRNKKAEWNSYRRQVTPYELQRYLPTL